MVDALTLFSRFGNDLEARAKMNPSRWGDLQAIANDIRHMVSYEMEDDE